MGAMAAGGFALGGPMGAMIGATADSGKAERKAAKRIAAAQESAAAAAAAALKNQPIPAQAKTADTRKVARDQAARRAAIAGIRSTYTAKNPGGSGGVKQTLGV